jgi:uncharacterized protein (DUF2267 family)
MKTNNYSRRNKMDELVKMVAKKTGLSPEMAKTAVTTVLDFLKKKLPAPIAGQIDAVLGGGAASGVADALGGMFGKKK